MGGPRADDELADFRLREQPVVTLDGQVYRWRVVLQPRRCPCSWAVLCASERAQGRPPMCETEHPSELTWEWEENGERW